jgi:hypothetical protein
MGSPQLEGWGGKMNINTGSKDTLGFWAGMTELGQKTKCSSTLCRFNGSLKFDDFKKNHLVFQIGLQKQT